MPGVIAAIALGLSLLVASDSADPSNRDVPTIMRADAHQGKTLTWVFTHDAYASCTQPAYVLRRIKQRYGDSVKLVVWYEGLDRNDVQSILTRERLSAVLLPLDAQAYEQWFGHSPEPVLHLIEDNRWVTSWSYTRRPIQVEEVMALL
jgi:hypothetical protein